MSDYSEIGRNARKAALEIQSLTSDRKNHLIKKISEKLLLRQSEIIDANQKDLIAAKSANVSASMQDRLMLDQNRIQKIAEALNELIVLKDPIGEVLESWTLYNGVHAKKVCVPFGVVAVIYEARPNVTIDAAAICLKTGNAVVLKGSSSALKSNIKLVEIMRDCCTELNIPEDAVQLISDPERSSIDAVLKMRAFVDVVIPRGGAGLINYVVENSSVPVIETGAGNCHLYLDSSADIEMAEKIAINAKVQRPAVCNSIETLLWHKDLNPSAILKIIESLESQGVECRVCEKTLRYASGRRLATLEDWSTEFSDYIIAIKQVDSNTSAIEHINNFGTRHSDAIITEDPKAAESFLNSIDSACVYWNASTRFTDGGEFGFGAEIGISTQKLHARGPMGLKELTSYKYVLTGNGQVR